MDYDIFNTFYTSQSFKEKQLQVLKDVHDFDPYIILPYLTIIITIHGGVLGRVMESCIFFYLGI